MEHLIHVHSSMKLDPWFNQIYIEMLKYWVSIIFYFFYHFLLYLKLSHFEILGISYNYSKQTYNIEKYQECNIRSGWKFCEWMNEWTMNEQIPFLKNEFSVCIRTIFSWWELIYGSSLHHYSVNILFDDILEWLFYLSSLS